MSNAVRIALLAVGDELLFGRIANTGGAELARDLCAAGYQLSSMEVVSDRPELIRECVVRVAARSDAVIVTGGLGPTPDDCTRESIADAAGVELFTDPKLLERVVRQTRGLAPDANEKQAAIPRGAASFTNPVGVAAAFRIDVANTPVYALPGVPVEMRALMRGAILPDLQLRFPVEAPEMASVALFGLAEAVAVDELGELLHREGEPEVGVTVGGGILKIVAVGRGARSHIDEVRAILADYVCEGGDPAHAAFAALKQRGMRVGVAESLTGGMVADSLVALPGASSVFAGGIIAYTPEMKHILLGVDPDVIDRQGVVSSTVALAMARGVRDRTGADYGVATTGAAGPQGESDGTPPGDGWVAVAGPGVREEARNIRSAGDRNAVRLRFSNGALDLLCRIVEES